VFSQGHLIGPEQGLHVNVGNLSGRLPLVAVLAYKPCFIHGILVAIYKMLFITGRKWISILVNNPDLAAARTFAIIPRDNATDVRAPSSPREFPAPKGERTLYLSQVLRHSVQSFQYSRKI
jgi:hypothetical protein